VDRWSDALQLTYRVGAGPRIAEVADLIGTPRWSPAASPREIPGRFPTCGKAARALPILATTLPDGANARLDDLGKAVIDRALVRIMSGDYGRCVSCGQPIPAVRLVAVPAADECHRA
jgi:hypothetical protein